VIAPTLPAAGPAETARLVELDVFGLVWGEIPLLPEAGGRSPAERLDQLTEGLTWAVK
jgi:hypothetical protein